MHSADERKEQLSLWWAKYERCSVKEQYILQLMSIFYTPVSTNMLHDACVAAQLHSSAKSHSAARPHPQQMAAFRRRLSKLEKQGLLIQEDNRLSLPPLALEELTLQSIEDDTFDQLVLAVYKALPQVYSKHKGKGHKHCESYNMGLRLARIDYYYMEDDSFQAWLTMFEKNFPQALAERHPLAAIFENTIDLDWFFTLPMEHIWDGLEHGFASAQWQLRRADQLLHLANAYCEVHDDALSRSLTDELAYHHFLRGEWTEAREQVAKREPHACLGMLLLLEGDINGAIEHLVQGIVAFRAASRQKEVYYSGLSGILLILALLSQDISEGNGRANAFLRQARFQKTSFFSGCYSSLTLFRRSQGNKKTTPMTAKRLLLNARDQALGDLIHWWLVHWLSPQVFSDDTDAFDRMRAAYRQARDNGYRWVAAEIGELLTHYDQADERTMKETEAFWAQHNATSLSHLFQAKAPWEYTLEALLDWTTKSAERSAPSESTREQRLTWRLKQDARKPSGWEITPYLQKLSARGTWSKGKRFSIQQIGQELMYKRRLDYMSDEDQKICQHIQRPFHYGQFHLETADALLAMVGHPLLFWADEPEQRIELFKEEARLQVLSEGEQITLMLDPPLPTDRSFVIRETSRSRLAITPVTEELQQVAGMLGQQLRLPLSAKDRVLEVLQAIAPHLTIHSDIGGSSEDVEQVEADPRIYVRMVPSGDGLKVTMTVAPFGEDGPRFPPGAKGSSIFANIDGTTRHTRRDLAEELRREEAVIHSCPPLAEPSSKHEHIWFLEEPEDCIALLEALELQGDTVVVEWPEGQHLRIRAMLSEESLQASVQQERDWFSITGELSIDADLVFELRGLLALLAQHQGRFIPLGNGEFLALTESFRARLDDIAAFTSDHKGKRRFHQSAAFAMQDTLDGLGGLQEDPHSNAWRELCKKLQTPPTVATPDTFQGTLREYQKDGFQWLARLAHWGMGACLADQMGLGKTLQALALLLHRAEDGPALVIAPTSVCANWSDEAARFAPSLRTHDLGRHEPDAREALLEGLGAGDLLMCSYGLLPYVEELLQKKPWNTVLLDEAQAIKNPLTQRAKAVSQLQTDCRILTTGTPIENHLGDLWSLFHFLNPHLLGTWRQFQQRFATPIEKENDAQAREKLKRLVQPFILRRLKQDVLKELPPRTEITLRVEPSKEELALYEVLRQDALANIASHQEGPGQLRFRILKELTRLRLACCHPSLAAQDCGVSSAKHTAFMEVLEGLLEEGRKALVFSQFVKHLQLLKGLLDEKGIQYQYLDGSTSAKARKKRIDAFQSGEGDVFLISLKAGGSGINLTEADYVLHMDPWWNPAVEDQASDRAHRIGQKNPVTIYRLIMQGTIEEKIVDLHQHKRDLAESLLDGSEMTGKMSADELIALIKAS